jgi:nucleoside-diphosphate-sugar epimerase
MILVSGGTGFVGRALVRKLASSGERVRILSRRPLEVHEVPAPSVECASGDLRDPESYAGALRDVSAVVHLGALLAGTAEELRAVNVEATRELARAARRAGARLFIHLSSAGVYGDRQNCIPYCERDPCSPATPYEHTKLASEDAIREALTGSDTGWAILRPTGVYGGERPATQAFLRNVVRRRIWLHATPQLWLNPIHVHDLVDAIALGLVQRSLSGEIFNVGGERTLTYPSWIAANARALGVQRPQLVVPPLVSAAAARACVGAVRLIRRPVPGRLGRAAQVICSRAVDISAIRERWGFTPTALEATLRMTIAEARALHPSLTAHEGYC